MEGRPSPKILGWVEPEEMAIAIKEMRETFPQFTITQSTPYFMEVTKLNVDKASGLKAMCEILDIDLEHSYGFGDGGNDFTMLELCPNAVTVENASDELKEVCIHVADVAENDGVSKFIIDKLS